MSRFVVYGAGAIGGLVGARLHQRGHEVTLVARGSHYDAICARGLRVVFPGGTVETLDIPVVDRIGRAEVDDDTTVLLGMKSQDTELALRELAASAPPGVAVACLQNGVDNERMALRRFRDVYAVCVMCPAVHLEPGVVEASTAPLLGILDLGRYPFGVDERAEHLAAALGDAGFLSEPRADVMAWKYAKLLGNLGNAVAALSGKDAARGEPGQLARREAEGILRAAGLEFVPLDEFRQRWEQMQRVPADDRSNSSWQSLARGTRSIEVDFLNGEIVLIARLHGLDAPLNDCVQRLARQLAASVAEPGTVPAADLLSAMNEALTVGDRP
jgi:2-dehydropantoate 2-reductase